MRRIFTIEDFIEYKTRMIKVFGEKPSFADLSHVGVTDSDFRVRRHTFANPDRLDTAILMEFRYQDEDGCSSSINVSGTTIMVVSVHSGVKRFKTDISEEDFNVYFNEVDLPVIHYRTILNIRKLMDIFSYVKGKLIP